MDEASRPRRGRPIWAHRKFGERLRPKDMAAEIRKPSVEVG